NVFVWMKLIRNTSQDSFYRLLFIHIKFLKTIVVFETLYGLYIQEFSTLTYIMNQTFHHFFKLCHYRKYQTLISNGNLCFSGPTTFFSKLKFGIDFLSYILLHLLNKLMDFF